MSCLMSDLKLFRQALFNDDEREYMFCSRTERCAHFDPHLKIEDRQYFCINPVKHSRKDINVTVFRNVLIEFDNQPLDWQLQFLKEVEVLPTTVVFSGNKSLHMIYSFEDPFESMAEYKLFAKRLMHVWSADKNCSNPSRLSRFPGYLRKETGKVQELLQINERVHQKDFEKYIGKMPKPKEKKYKSIKGIFLSDRTLEFVHKGAELFGSRRPLNAVITESENWNTRLYEAACNYFRNINDFEYILDKFSRIDQELTEKDINTIRSAYKSVYNITP